MDLTDPTMSRPAAVLHRRHVLRTMAGAAAAALAGGAGVAGAAATPGRQAQPVPATRDLVVVGANPGLQLFDGDAVTAYASTWRVDWSPLGRGTALILWRDGAVHVYGADPELATWLEREFVRFFPEVAGLPWPDPVVVRTPVRLENDLATGMTARAHGVRVHMSDVLDRRTFATDDFPLGEVTHSLSLVLAPCGAGTITVDGYRVPGEIQRGGTPDRPGSSAFTTEAEVWKR
ncbi:MAG TPA: hypothetical protein VFI47_03525 [Acidimicrobiales bacterium]|nr:hypothetical protein [Acidimicrobiales bacterium]